MRFIKSSKIYAPSSEVFTWHKRPGALERLTPPWEKIKILERTGGLENGKATIKIKTGFFNTTWTAVHFDYVEGKQFCDRQVSGPFNSFVHKHIVESKGEKESLYIDEIEYELPFGVFGKLGGRYVEQKLQRGFNYRHRTIANDISLHMRYGLKPLKILITGSSGLIGSALVNFLSTGGHRVYRTVKSIYELSEANIYWDIDKMILDPARLEGIDIVIHLAGENIANRRWSKRQKQLIRDSRVNGTKLVSEAIAKTTNGPKVLISASAIGYYGDRGDDVLTEQSSCGSGFLSAVAKEWEDATISARNKGLRVVNMRTGVVLSGRGGALQKMLTPFKMCVGGPLGGGSQYMSWISIDDWLGALLHCIAKEDIIGPVNIVSPYPVTNYDFTKALGSVLRRPTVIPMPSLMAKLAFGQMAKELLLASTRVFPKKLADSGYNFLFSDLNLALCHTLGL